MVIENGNIRTNRVFILFLLSLTTALNSGCATEDVKPKKTSNVERARLLVEIANGALMEGDPTGALQNLERAEKIDPVLPELFHSRALAYSAKHEPELALASARKAISLKDDYVEAKNTYGKLLIDAGRYEEALAPLNAAAHDPLYRDSFKAWTNLGILFYREKKYTNSMDSLNRAILDAPGRACIAYYYRGHIYYRQKHFKEAVRSYDSATQKYCAGFADAHYALGLAYEQNNQVDEARRTFLEIQKQFPNTKLAERALGQLRTLP